MSEAIITVEGLGKRYRLDARNSGERYTALRDVITEKASGIFKKLKTENLKSRHRWPDVIVSESQRLGVSRPSDDFWALKDVSFEVRQGEVVGIIGRNGAGKSTLLKILSRITEPTEGRIKIKGRVASLLEVGTGFHPELTGRENIYLNGAILGMQRSEIKAKFDEIVAFAEVEKFLDTPVKRYSSGMYVRLAFAVAAHLEPEILVIDEVLAVGDAEFQKKCIGKMGDVAKGGRTVLFVSHDMRKVTALCEQGILLNAGRIEIHGSMRDVAGHYLQGRTEGDGFADLRQRSDRSGNGEAQFQTIELLKEQQRSTTFAFGESFTQKITVKVKQRLAASLVAVVITSGDGVPVHELWNVNERCHWVAKPGNYEFIITIPKLCLYPGIYSIDLWMGTDTSDRVDYITEALTFYVVQTTDSGLERPLDRSNGLVFQHSRWVHDRVQ